MIGSDTLLFPDTGPDFLRALRTAVLYSKQVHVLTMPDIRMAEVMTKAFDDSGKGSVDRHTVPKRLSEYFTFVLESHKDLSLLKNAGVLVPLEVGGLNVLRKSRADKGSGVIVFAGFFTPFPRLHCNSPQGNCEVGRGKSRNVAALVPTEPDCVPILPTQNIGNRAPFRCSILQFGS